VASTCRVGDHAETADAVDTGGLVRILGRQPMPFCGTGGLLIQSRMRRNLCRRQKINPQMTKPQTTQSDMERGALSVIRQGPAGPHY
jgi:hypothetical protein